MIISDSIPSQWLLIAFACIKYLIGTSTKYGRMMWSTIHTWRSVPCNMANDVSFHCCKWQPPHCSCCPFGAPHVTRSSKLTHSTVLRACCLQDVRPVQVWALRPVRQQGAIRSCPFLPASLVRASPRCAVWASLRRCVLHLATGDC